MPVSKISLKEKISEIAGRPFSPVDVVKVNGQVVRIALFRGEYHWHAHDNYDELFYVLSGELVIQVRGQQDFVLKPGELTAIPKGVEHCPRSAKDSYVLMFEPHR